MNALLVGQLARLAAFGRGGQYKTGGVYGRIAVAVIAIGISCLQVYGVSSALAASGLVNVDARSFLLTTMASYAGVTALLIFLIERFDTPGLQNGFWALSVSHF